MSSQPPPPKPQLPNPNPNPTLYGTATTINGGRATSHKKCSYCEFSTRCPLFIHNVRFRGVLRRLCTSCVLRLHPSSFCPTCFLNYDSNPPHSSKRLTCSNCSSYTHSTCGASNPSSTKPYLCRACADSSFKFFDLDKARVKSREGIDKPDRDRLVVDKNLATALLCAAKISSASMHKAVVVARAEAERRVREAAMARKRAREALERVVSVDCMWKQKKKKKGQGEGKINGIVSVISGSGDVANGDGDKHVEKNADESAFKKEDVIVEGDSGEQQNVDDHGAVPMDEKNIVADLK